MCQISEKALLYKQTSFIETHMRGTVDREAASYNRLQAGRSGERKKDFPTGEVGEIIECWLENKSGPKARQLRRR